MAFSLSTPVKRNEDPPSKLSANDHLAPIVPLAPP